MNLNIETSRLLLRPLKESDAAEIARATDETWADLSQWMRWATNRDLLTDVENCRRYATECERKFLQKEDFTFGGFLKETPERFVLLSRLAHLGDRKGHYEFGGYWCRKSYQGNGFMGEAVAAIIRYAQADMDAKSFQITHAVNNIATRKVIDRLGFVETHIRQKAHRLPNGEYVDEPVLVYSTDEQKI